MSYELAKWIFVSESAQKTARDDQNAAMKDIGGSGVFARLVFNR